MCKYVCVRVRACACVSTCACLQSTLPIFSILQLAALSVQQGEYSSSVAKGVPFWKRSV